MGRIGIDAIEVYGGEMRNFVGGNYKKDSNKVMQKNSNENMNS